MASRKESPFAFDAPAWVNTLLHHKKMRKIICDHHFKEFDTNENGQLEEGELTHLCEAVCTSMNVDAPDKDDLHRAFLKFDVSQSGGLTTAEFPRFFEHLLRTSLPLMTQGKGKGSNISSSKAAGKCNGGGYNPVDTAKVAATVGVGISVTVRALGGDVIWGPSELDAKLSVADLQGRLAKTLDVPKIAVLLISKNALLVPDQSLEVSGVKDGDELTATVASPECLVETALLALAECPAPELVHSRDESEEAQEAFYCYDAWHRSGACVVSDQLQHLAPQVKDYPAYHEKVQDLALRILEDGVKIDLSRPGSGMFYSDDLTWMAAHVLPHVVSPGSQVNKIVTLWVQRSRPINDYTPVMSEWTIGELLRNIGKLFDTTDRKVRRQALWDLWQSGRANIYYEHSQDEWLPFAIYWAIVELMEPLDVKRLAFEKDGQWSRFIQRHGLTDHLKHRKVKPTDMIESEDEEWMEEYIYKRT